MSSLSNVEKRKFEQLLGMNSGYVLDFSNRSFAQFVVDSTGRNIYDARYNYGNSGSKANRLRGFWQKEENPVVGRLMNDLLEYGFSGSAPSARKEACRQIVTRLLQEDSVVPTYTATPQKEDSAAQRRSKVLAQMKDDFFQLAAESDRAKAGFALEKLLNRLFEVFDLHPRQSFRVVGEQIDGSFELESHIYLLESKWEQQALPASDLLIFRGKIEGKSTFTRGVFIALNDISAPARDAITRGKSPSFFVINGHDLVMILSEVISLTDFLKQRVRLLAEEGRVCVPFAELPKPRPMV